MSAVPVPSNPADAPADASLPPSGGFVRCGDLELGLGSLKQPEEGDGVILRLYEPHGARGLASLTFPSEVKRAERVTLLEEHDDSVLAEATEPIVAGDTIRISVRPFEVVTLRVVL